MFSGYNISICALISALWAIPLVRAVFYLLQASGVIMHTGSINAANDLRYATWLLLCYLASLFLSFVCVRAFFQPPRFSLILPAGLLVFAVIEVLGVHPEEPIVIAPAMDPLRPVYITLAAIAIAAIMRYFHNILQPDQAA